MKLPDTAHTDRPWRIHGIAPDFRLYDVWALPTPGGPEDFDQLIQLFAGGDTGSNSSRAARLLFAIRWKLGALLGWDDADRGAATLRDRLPADLRAGPQGPAFATLPFTSIYRADNEFAAELVNRTVHAVLHLGWVGDEAGAAGASGGLDEGGGCHGQMAVLVKPRGLLGRAYMASIGPFRHLIVYPPMMKDIGREWQARVPRGR